jgi:hypothetical protein
VSSQPILLLSMSVFAQQTDKSANAALVEDFRQSPYFFRQIEIGNKIVALNDSSLLEKMIQ